jgi:hypothetical protein
VGPDARPLELGVAAAAGSNSCARARESRERREREREKRERERDVRERDVRE